MNGEFHTVRGYQMLNSENKVLTSSLEDYLEMLYRICLKDEYAHMKQLANKLNVRPSSATKVIQKLSELKLVDYRKYGVIKLTKEGEAIGQFLLNRHEIIQDFLRNLGVRETLLKDTELIEHDVSTSALKQIDRLNRFLRDHPKVKAEYEAYIPYKRE